MEFVVMILILVFTGLLALAAFGAVITGIVFLAIGNSRWIYLLPPGGSVFVGLLLVAGYFVVSSPKAVPSSPDVRADRDEIAVDDLTASTSLVGADAAFSQRVDAAKGAEKKDETQRSTRSTPRVPVEARGRFRDAVGASGQKTDDADSELTSGLPAWIRDDPIREPGRMLFSVSSAQFARVEEARQAALVEASDLLRDHWNDFPTPRQLSVADLPNGVHRAARTRMVDLHSGRWTFHEASPFPRLGGREPASFYRYRAAGGRGELRIAEDGTLLSGPSVEDFQRRPSGQILSGSGPPEFFELRAVREAVVEEHVEPIRRTAGENEFTVYRVHLLVEQSAETQVRLYAAWVDDAQADRSGLVLVGLAVTTLASGGLFGVLRLGRSWRRRRSAKRPQAAA